ncbi:MAG: methyltransferase domain-containing protein [Chloroflexota bacterium]
MMHPPNCPVCLQAIETCASFRDGVCHLLEPDMQRNVNALMQLRRTKTVSSTDEIGNYNNLPHSMTHTHFEWHIRAYDVANVLHLLKRRPQQTIIEIGPWNGWLTHHLVRDGHTITTLAYSDDDEHGLRSKSHYNVGWQSVQMDVGDLSKVQGRADVVIINHGLHLFADPVRYVQQVRGLLSPGGMLIVLCMVFFRDPSSRKAQLEQQQAAFRQQHDTPYFLRPSRGYMDADDITAFKRNGLQLHRYPGLWRSEVKATLRPQSPLYRWGVLMRYGQ